MLSCDQLGDHVMPQAEVRTSAQESPGNISVLSHLKKRNKLHVACVKNLLSSDVFIFHSSRTQHRECISGQQGNVPSSFHFKKLKILFLKLILHILAHQVK